MPHVLDQNEIDALLAAVDQGAIVSEPDAAAASASAEGEGSHGADGSSSQQAQVRNYDFKRPERVSKEQMRSLESLHEGFSRNFGASLSGYLRTIVETYIVSIEQMTYSEFLQLLPNPTCMNLLTCAPLEGSMILEINPLIIFPIIDRLLGGGSDAAFIPDRGLTGIESLLANRIISRALDSLHDAWRPIREINFAISHTESNPAMVQIVPPNEVVVVVGFEIGTGGRSGMMSLCIPFNVIEPIMGEFTGHNWSMYRRDGDNQMSRQTIINRISSTTADLRAHLADTTITLDELMNLKVGDVLKTDRKSDSQLLITINGKPKFRGKPGIYRGHKAVSLTRVVKSDEAIS